MHSPNLDKNIAENKSFGEVFTTQEDLIIKMGSFASRNSHEIIESNSTIDVYDLPSNQAQLTQIYILLWILFAMELLTFLMRLHRYVKQK